MIFDAEAMARAHKVSLESAAPFTRWHCSGDRDLNVRSLSPTFYAETVVDTKDPAPLNFAVPSGLAWSWLNGASGPIEASVAGEVLTLTSERSSIEIATQTEGPDLFAAEHLDFSTNGLQVLGLGGDVWSAVDAIAWASAKGSESNVDARYEAAHCSFGKVWATDRTKGAWIDMDLPEGALPMIHVDLGRVAKLVGADTAVVAVDLANRLRIIAEHTEVVVPLIAGERFPDHMAHPAIDKVRQHGNSFRFAAKDMLDALVRLDRVDMDKIADRANMKARVEMTCTPTQIRLSVLIDKRRATETIDADNDGEFVTISQLKNLRSAVKFLATPEVTLRYGSQREPIVADAGDRHLMVMPVTGVL